MVKIIEKNIKKTKSVVKWGANSEEEERQKRNLGRLAENWNSEICLTHGTLPWTAPLKRYEVHEDAGGDTFLFIGELCENWMESILKHQQINSIILFTFRSSGLATSVRTPAV